MEKNSIVIFSFSTLAIQIANTLQLKHYHITIVEEDLELAQKAKNLGYEVVNLSLMDDENIKKLHLSNDTIKAFFSLHDDKNINLFVTLSVRNFYQNLKIITVSFNSSDNKAFQLAGADKIINPYEIGALRIFRTIHKPFLVDVLDNILFSESHIEVSEITIEAGSPFDGVYLKEIELFETNNLILLGIQDRELNEKFIFYSRGLNHKLDTHDTLVVLGNSNDIKNFKSILNNQKQSL